LNTWVFVVALTSVGAAPLFAEEIGEIGIFLSTYCPTNYTALDGGVIGSIDPPAAVPLYRKICAIVPGNGCNGDIQKPDFRGEFIRGLDSGRGVDSFRVVGSTQAHRIQGHYHSFTLKGGVNYDTGVWGSSNYSAYTAGGFYNGHSSGDTTNNVVVKGPISDGSNGSVYFGSDTRPRNLAALFCVRYAVSSSTSSGSVINMIPSTFTLVAISTQVAADLNPGIWGYFTAGDVSFWTGILFAIIVIVGFKAGGMR